jgi:periplasmic protein TonB
MITVFPKLRLEPEEAEKQLVERVEPEYPTAAKQAAIQGTVLLALTIGTDGVVTEVQEISGPRELIPAAVAAVKRWRYRPTVLKGRAWEVSTEVGIQFKLPE